MAIELGSLAPDFNAKTTEGEIRFHDWIGEQWCVFFSYPRDHSAVCMTELAVVSQIQPQLARRNAKALGVCITSIEKHHDWSADFPTAQGCSLNFPLAADPDGNIASLYGMVHPQHAGGVTSRCLFIIDPARKLRMFAMYPTGVGRNFDEVLRIIDSLQLNARHGLTTPANWRAGELAVIPPGVSDEQAQAKYPSGYNSITPYLRVVKPPE